MVHGVITTLNKLITYGLRNTKLSLTQMSMIDMVLSSKSFVFNGRYYEQIYGSPMGSPLSSIIADIVMEDLETLSLQKLDFTYLLQIC